MNGLQFKILLTIQIGILSLVSILFYRESAPGNSFAEHKGNARVNVNYAGNYIYGQPSAKNELVVFSQYGCGFCRDFYLHIFDRLKSDYISTGLLKVVFIHSVSPDDKMEMLKVKIAEIGRKFDLYEILQAKFYGDGYTADSSGISDIALAAGMPARELNSMPVREVLSVLLSRNMEESKHLQITGTPTFILNGRKMVGYRGVDDFMAFFSQQFVK